MQQKIPDNLNYNEIKPIGYPSRVRSERFTPVAFNTSTSGVTSGDVIRFNISNDGFWDPYSAYIKIEVDVSNMDGNIFRTPNASSSATGAGCLQLDNSASSFINQLIIYKSGVELERIEEYDTIAAILNDVNTSFDNRASRNFEGMQGQNCSGNNIYNNLILQPATTYQGYQSIITQYPSTVTSVTTNQLNGTGGVSSGRYEFLLSGMDGKNFIQPSPSLILSGQVVGNIYTTQQGVQTNYPANYGYVVPFNQSLSAYGNESVLTTNYLTNTIYKGFPQQIVMNKQTFCIPLISGILGVLMPKESYKYIPMKALQELIVEFRLNPYAMFTSGYADGASNVNNTTGNCLLNLATQTNPMLSRIWKITKFELCVEVQYFESTIENIILSQLQQTNGIVLHTQSWLLGPRYQQSANTSPNGTFQVNLGFESLKNIISVFIPDEFTTYSFCRKQYRLGANITSFQLKIGSEYYPPLPITGHSGNSAGYSSLTNDSDFSNSEFLISLYKTFGKFQDIQNNCIVNSQNFSVNFRAYDPTKTSAYTNGTQVVNWDTAMGQSQFHENRCVGRAIYAMNLETLNQDTSVICGVNTIKYRPFEINFRSDNTNAYPRSYTQYIFCNYDLLLQLSLSGVQVLGRG